ncbi:MAG: glycosyltransferase family 2 protein [Spirochaetota bacterium]|nr:MAG: glycosyltransferase family 2 protein [Spirochaetota bacterium]
MKISIILPVYNEASALKELYSLIKTTVDKCKNTHEVLFIDDGSTDGSLAVLRELKVNDSSIKIISFDRKYGQASALQAGFDSAEGDIIITLDADMENDPEDIPLLLKKLEEGYDVVCGRRVGRPLTVKKFFSFFGNFIFRKIFKTPVKDMACTFRAYRRKVLEDIVIRGSLHRYLPVLLHLKGAKIGEIDVRWVERSHGESKYGVMDRLFPTIKELLILVFKKKMVLMNRDREYRIQEVC